MAGAESKAVEQSIEKILGLSPNSDLGDIADAFFNSLKEEITTIKEDPSDKKYSYTQDYITTTYKLFFDFSMKWAAATRKKSQKTPNHPDAQDLKKKAAEALSGLQDDMLNFAQIYMNISYAEGCVLQEILKHESSEKNEKRMKWTSDSEYMLKRNITERTELLEANARLIKGLDLMEENKDLYQTIANTVVKLVGEKSLEDHIRPFRSALRMGDFTKARAALVSLDSVKGKLGSGKDTKVTLQKLGTQFIDLLETEEENLKGQDEKIFLNAQEIKALIAVNQTEIEQKEKYIKKYQIPYMDGKIAKFRYFYEKMLVVGSIESFITLYMRLVRGIAQPLKDIKEVRIYEEEVIQNINYLMAGQFQEVNNIEDRRQEEMEDFYATLKDFDEIFSKNN